MIIKSLVPSCKRNCFNVLSQCRQITKERPVKNDSKIASDVLKYVEGTKEYEDIKDNIPKHMLKKYKTPESMHLINRQTASIIANILRDHLDKNSLLVEVNPGFGFLSEEILKAHINHIYMYETTSQLSQYISLLGNKYPKRITYKIADFFGMWKLAFMDKLDDGNRIRDLLGDLSVNSNDRLVKIIGSMPGLSFIKHLINSIVFHNDTNQLGKPDLFITMPMHHFEFLTDTAIQHSKHRFLPAIFQVLFDYKVLERVPKVHFLPWMYPVESKKISVLNDHSLYLVNITQKDELPCSPEYLPLLWYFFKPHMISKSTRVIPMLEQWIPGCGVRLITGQDPADTRTELSPTQDDAPLPHMSIFTEYGDLNLKQKLTVFKRFISWPEFEQCPFRVTMLNNLPKSMAGVDEDDDSKNTIHIEDDEDHLDPETET